MSSPNSGFTLSAHYEQQFRTLLESPAVADAIHSEPEAQVASWPAFGPDYAPLTGLLVVGRATNGLDADGIAPHDFDPAAVTRSARHYSEQPNRLSWVPAQRRSAFWQVTRLVAIGTGVSSPAESAWWRRIGWSNLAKIAPLTEARRSRRHDANPTPRLLRTQARLAAELVRIEIQEARPKIVLVIAGTGWYDPLLELIGRQVSVDSTQRFLDQAFVNDGVFWALTRRPEFRPGSRASLAAEVIAAYRELVG